MIAPSRNVDLTSRLPVLSLYYKICWAILGLWTLALTAGCRGPLADSSGPTTVPASKTTSEVSGAIPATTGEIEGLRHDSIAMAYLRHDATLEDLAKEFMAPNYRMVSLADVHMKFVELRETYDQVVGEGETIPAAERSPGQTHELSINGLALFYSAQAVGGTFGADSQFAPAYYPPTWFYYRHTLLEHDLISPVAEYDIYLQNMAAAIRSHIYSTRLSELVTLHESVLPSLLCLESTAINQDGLLPKLIEDVEHMPLELARHVGSHPEVLRRAEAAGVSAEAIGHLLRGCTGAERFPAFELAYDFAAAFAWLHEQVLSFLEEWVSANSGRQPEGLIFVD